jgi:hypothetical protein
VRDKTWKANYRQAPKKEKWSSAEDVKVNEEQKIYKNI